MDKRNNPTYRKCKGTSKRTKQACTARAMDGSDYCYHHGGASKKGAALPQFKHGKFSEHLPTRLAAIYKEIEADLEVNILSRNLRLREMFLREKLEMLDEAPDSAKAWSELRGIADEMHKAFENDNLGLVQVSLMQLDRLINNMEAYHMAVDEIRRDLSEQRKDSQIKAAITLKGENAIGINELITFVGAIMNLISTTVSNQDERNKIYNAIERLTRVEESPARELAATTASLNSD